MKLVSIFSMMVQFFQTIGASLLLIMACVSRLMDSLMMVSPINFSNFRMVMVDLAALVGDRVAVLTMTSGANGRS